MSTVQVDVDASDALISNFSSRMIPQLRSFPTTIPTTELQNLSHLVSAKNNRVEEEIRKHEAEISRLRSAVIALENKRKGLERFSAGCRSLLNPIRRLPVEILRKIFLHLGDCIQVQLGLVHVFCSALTLAAVCGAWRNLALSTSELWSQISIVFNGTVRLRSSEVLVNMVLERSRNAPLEISLSVSWPSRHLPHPAAVSAIVQSVASHSNHWHHVTLDLPNQLYDEAWNLSVGNLPLLESLSLIRAPPPSDFIAPKLRNLGLFSKTPLPTLKLPWHQFSKLNLDRDSFSDILAIVNLCPNLQKLCFVGRFPMTTGITPTMIHNLQVLKIIEHRAEHTFKTALSSFTLPQLSRLCLDASLQRIIWSDEAECSVKTFLQRSACTITTLQLEGLFMVISNSQLISLLRLLPSIKELAVTQSESRANATDDADSLLTSLNFNSESFNQPLLPKLQKIKLGW